MVKISTRQSLTLVGIVLMVLGGILATITFAGWLIIYLATFVVLLALITWLFSLSEKKTNKRE